MVMNILVIFFFPTLEFLPALSLSRWGCLMLSDFSLISDASLLRYCSAKDREIVCCFPPAPSLWLTRDNYAPLSSYCQAQFATQIKRAASEEQGGRGWRRKREREREDATKTEGQRRNNGSENKPADQTSKLSNAILLGDFWIYCATFRDKRSPSETKAEGKTWEPSYYYIKRSEIYQRFPDWPFSL